MNNVNARLAPAMMLVGASALWGAATVINKYLLGSVPPIFLLTVQLTASAAFLWTIALITAARAPRRGDLVPVILLGVLNPGVSYTLGLIALERISASVTTLLWATEPMMILALAAFILREPATSRMLVAVAGGVVGVVLITGADADFGWAVDPVGGLLLAGAVFSCAVYTVFSRKLTRTVDPLAMITVQQTAGLAWALALLAVSKATGFDSVPSRVDMAHLSAAAISGLMYYALAYWLYLAALKSVPAVIAGASFNLIPIFGIGLAMIFLGERLSALQWAGALLILLAVFDLLRHQGGPAARVSSLP